ncbi:KilA-N domain-containing protein [Providencia rettgeri]|uniref:KilA-N domain-containing protein n=1 Tax=Providencia rettgeri TaxID=587 RepID=UPI001D0D323B|nr:KilA-N domain-containing protein [Providencia rettgeri]MCF8965193.1 hypothetical protein [Providencia rettgeri]UDQ68887.1 KilA-N domain-containing protein [Providencia rettgeri]
MTNQLIISNTQIKQDADGRYSLNDLHKAAGNERRHEPNLWLGLLQTKELIKEILNTGIPVFKNDEILNAQICPIKNGNEISIKPHPVSSKKGRYGGTYVCKELVYSYAMWISAAFSLKVIRAYDALVSQKSQSLELNNDLNVVKSAINYMAEKNDISYQRAYSIIHQQFGVKSIEQLDASVSHEVISFAYSKAIEGEYIPKNGAISQPRKQFNDKELVDLVWLWRAGTYMLEVFSQIEDSLSKCQHPQAQTVRTMAWEYIRVFDAPTKALKRETNHIGFDENKVEDWNKAWSLPALRNTH